MHWGLSVNLGAGSLVVETGGSPFQGGGGLMLEMLPLQLGEKPDQ